MRLDDFFSGSHTLGFTEEWRHFHGQSGFESSLWHAMFHQNLLQPHRRPRLLHRHARSPHRPPAQPALKARAITTITATQAVATPTPLSLSSPPPAPLPHHGLRLLRPWSAPPQPRQRRPSPICCNSTNQYPPQLLLRHLWICSRASVCLSVRNGTELVLL